MPQQIISALQRVREDRNGEYTLVLPINTVEDVFVSLKSGVRLSALLQDIIEDVDDTKLTLVEDMSTVINNLAGLIDSRLPLNHLYRENLKTSEHVSITEGTFTQGSIKATQDEKVDFKLKSPIELNYLPEKFKLTQMSKYVGNPEITYLITFNANDTKPAWYDCTASVASGLFTNVPKIENKEPNKPYAINLRVKAACDSSSTYEIMEFSILHV